jgi:hypothetical protein
LEESGIAADGEEITNKIPRFGEGLTKHRSGKGCQSVDLSDVPDLRGLQAFHASETKEFGLPSQGLVNHVSQGLVNHAGRCSASDFRLTSLFKQKRTPLG